VRRFVPGIEAKVQKQIKETVASIHKNMISHSLKSIKDLPEYGASSASLRKELVKYSELGQQVWKNGRVSGAVYNGGSIDLNNLVSEAFSTFSVSNVCLTFIIIAITSRNFSRSSSNGGRDSIYGFGLV
jgi:hypothetical protein